MTITTKYNIGDECFFLGVNKIASGIIKEIKIITVIRQVDTETVTESEIEYKINHILHPKAWETLKEGQFFPTKQALLESL